MGAEQAEVVIPDVPTDDVSIIRTTDVRRISQVDLLIPAPDLGDPDAVEAPPSDPFAGLSPDEIEAKKIRIERQREFNRLAARAALIEKPQDEFPPTSEPSAEAKARAESLRLKIAEGRD